MKNGNFEQFCPAKMDKQIAINSLRAFLKEDKKELELIAKENNWFSTENLINESVNHLIQLNHAL